MELQHQSSSKLPGYELLTGASLGMSVPWSVCVMPGEVSCRQRGNSKCFLYPGLSSPAGSHDPADHKPAPAVGHNSKVQTVVQCDIQPNPHGRDSPDPVVAKAMGSDGGRYCPLLALGSG